VGWEEQLVPLQEGLSLMRLEALVVDVIKSGDIWWVRVMLKICEPF